MNVMKTVQKVYDLMMDGGNENLDKAAKLMNSIKKEDLKKLSKSELGEFFFICGQMAYCKNFPDEAIKMLKAALKLVDETKKAEVLYFIGSSYNDKDNYKLALKYFKKALNIKNLSDKIKINILAELSLCYRNLDKYGKALRSYYKIIEIFKDSKLSLNDYYYNAVSSISTCYWKLGEDRKADDYANEILLTKNVPDWVMKSTYCILGHRYLEKKEYKKAKENYKKALNLAEEKTNKDFYKDLIAECNEGLKKNKQ